MTRLFRDVSTEYRRLLCPSAHAFVGDWRSAHLNFSVPDFFAPRLIGDCAEMFSRSVEACVDLLSRSLFQGARGTNEQLNLSTHIGGVVPVEYILSIHGDVPIERIEHLGEIFMVFVRRTFRGDKVETRPENGFKCDYRTVHTALRSANDASLELEVHLPHDVSMLRWQEFTGRILEAVQCRPEKAEEPKIHLVVGEYPDRMGPDYCWISGKIYGVSSQEVRAEVSALLDRITYTFHQ